MARDTPVCCQDSVMALLRPRLAAAMLAGLILAAAGLAVAPAPAALSAAAASPWHASEVLSPPGGGYGMLNTIACSTRATCIAGGSFDAASRGELPMIAVESAGKWGRAVALRLPPGANPADQNALVASVACPGPKGENECVAVGYYDDAAGMQAFAAEGSGTRWGRASKITLPPGAGASGTGALSGLRCKVAGACIAVGGYESASGSDAGMVVTQSRGRWLRGARIAPPANAATTTSNAHLSAIACEAADECVAVGAYFTKSGASEGMAVTEVKGRWAKSVATPAPGNAPKLPEVELYSIGCSPHRYCVAVGAYFTKSGAGEALAVFYEGGRWRLPAGVTALPANASASDPGASLDGVSCGALTCLAVGDYKDRQGAQQAMAISEAGGRWEGAPVGLPAHAALGTAQQAYLFGVMCTPDWCAAGGQYVDGARVPEAMAAWRLGTG
jgi:hypothetical protein